MKTGHLRDYIIIPTLKYLDLLSNSGINLLLGIAAQESHLGEYLHQINGCAMGIYQMEPETVIDLQNNFLDYRPKLDEKIGKLRISAPKKYFPGDTEIEGNLYYATAMTRIFFLRFPESLPKADDIEGLAVYWKKYYNTEKGKGKITDFIYNYNKYVLGDI